MRIVSLERQRGKTETLIEWVRAKPNRVIIVMSAREADRIIRKYGLSSLQVLIWGMVPGARGRDVEIAIDNLDLILRQVCGDVKIVTVTKEE